MSRYVVNRNEGIDILHIDPREECNLDDARGRQEIDPDTADALLSNVGFSVKLCQHCGPATATVGGPVYTPEDAA